MTRRVNSDLLLVGSLPADSTEGALRSAGEFFGDLVFALPDGETGPRAGWVSYERERLARPNPGVVVVRETESPTGLPRHAYETPVFGVRPGVTELHWDTWPRIDDAIESYAVFARLRADGVIPAGLRFQIGLPFPASALNAFKADFAHDYPIAARGFEDLVARELGRLTDAIPPEDLAIQWDLAYETQDIERVLAWTAEGAWERFAGPVTRLTRLDPSPVLVGYHLCYGTFPEWPMYEARDMALLVRMANFAIANSGRTVDWVHLAGPAVPAQRGPQLLPAAGRPGAGRRPGVPRHRAADRRGAGAAPPPRHRVPVPARLRRGDVLRLRPPAGPRRHRDDARARARSGGGPHPAGRVGRPRFCRVRRMTADQLLDALLDAGSYRSWDGAPADVRPDPGYAAELARARAAPDVTSRSAPARGCFGGHRVAVAVSEFGFLGGSIGVAAAQRLTLAVERATAERLPLIAAPASGGTRMQEGTVAFLQMATITAAVAAHQAAGLPYLVYLRHPTTGGVFASWASVGHLTLAEPGALIGFLGPRVYEALTGAAIPDGVQTAENLLAHGLVDAVVPPDRAGRATSPEVLTALTPRRTGAGPAPAPAPLPRPRPLRVDVRRDGAGAARSDRASAWESVLRHPPPATGRARPT